MTIAFAKSYALVPRGGPGLACDDDGVALGPIPLVDAEAFAAALQNSGKFGVYDNGAKVPTYVPEVAATIRGLREIVARRTI
ncbi:MAG: hypothetical protein ACREET_15160 [Stellaceae bacterium]